MSVPVYKIELWDTTPTKLHTIEDDAELIRVKEVITNNVGTFSFALPTKYESSYKYNDVNVGDTAKIWFGYDSVPTDPITIGKIYQISAPFSVGSGYVRVFSGRNQGEVAQRRFKTKRWEAVEASTIVSELATDLGLGTGDIEATSGKLVTMQVDDKKYWDLLQELSDYWISGGNELSKDFYVDVDNDLVWKVRPFRTSGVETFTVDDNVLSYNVTRDMTQLYNKIMVLGAAERVSNNNRDTYCEVTSNGHTWSAPLGGTITTNGDSMLGTYSIQIYEAASNLLCARLSLDAVTSVLYQKEFKTLNFNIKVPSTSTVGTISVRLNRAITSNYFNKIMTPDYHGVTVGGDFKPFSLHVGKKYEGGPYNETWQINGDADWKDINSVEFRIAFTASADQTARIDAVYFGDARFIDTAEDSTSQDNYGVKELLVIDDSLRSNSECEAFAEALIDLHKDPALQIELVVPGNTNVLLGDRLNMTLPAEDISSQNFDVFSVEHSFAPQQGFITTAIMNSSSKQRRKIPTNVNDLAIQTRRLTKEALMVKRVLS